MKGGLFITLHDKKTLKLYLDRGIYGFLMPPSKTMPSYQSPHFRAVADYGCSRNGTHVFFFLKRRIYYGGQLKGSSKHGSFYLNGRKSPLGQEANVPLVWDESTRDTYQETAAKGVFKVDADKERCQPYLIQFDDRLGLAGNYVVSDQFYLELADYPYPLSSNVIAGMGFCTMSPGETDTLLRLLEEEPDGSVKPESEEDVFLEGKPVPFSPEYGIQSLDEAEYESHLEASATSNPNLLPSELRPSDQVICRQVPVSPFKPLNLIDKADVCYFSENRIENGMIPNTIIELKCSRAGKGPASQVNRYLEWLYRCLSSDTAEKIDVYVLAPGFTRTFSKYISDRFRKQVQRKEF